MNTIQTLEECKDLINKVYLIDDLASRSRRQNMNDCTNKQLEGIVKLMKKCLENNNKKNQYDHV